MKAIFRSRAARALLIVYQGHNPQFAQVEHVIADFGPHLKFVHCVREPLPSLGSWLAHVRSSELGGALDLPFRVLGRALDHAKPILNQWPGDGAKPPLVSWNERNTRAVRLEDLHQHPRETLERLCAWLDIPWDDALLQSTFDGKLWHWTDGKRVLSGFQRRTEAKTHGDGFTGFDRLRLRLLLADKYRAWNYPLPRWCRSAALAWLSVLTWIAPFGMEVAVWRRQESWSPSRAAAAAAAYARMRAEVFRRWRRDRHHRDALLKLL